MCFSVAVPWFLNEEQYNYFWRFIDSFFIEKES